MKDTNYIIIPAFLRTKLDLKGSELIITALIYGFSQDGVSWFSGSIDYIANWAGIASKNVVRCLKSLVDKGILEKKEVLVNNKAKRCYYRVTQIPELQNVTRGNNSELQNIPDPELQNIPNSELQNVTLYNSDNNIVGDNIERGENGFSPAPTQSTEVETELDLTLFTDPSKPKKEKVAKKRKRGTNEGEMILFADSVYYDFNEFEKCFQKPEFADVDIVAYYHKVADWSSAGLNKKADWIATARNWMRKDKEAGKLQTIKKESFEMDEGMKFYLNL